MFLSNEKLYKIHLMNQFSQYFVT